MRFRTSKLITTLTRTLFCTCLICFGLFNCKEDTKTYENATSEITLSHHFKENITKTILFLDSLETTISKNEKIEYYKQARAHFKTLEPLLAFVDSENYKFLNQPNILKVEEEDATDIKVKLPYGFQVLEEQLFDDTSIVDIIKNSTIIKNRLQLIKANTHL